MSAVHPTASAWQVLRSVVQATTCYCLGPNADRLDPRLAKMWLPQQQICVPVPPREPAVTLWYIRSTRKRGMLWTSRHLHTTQGLCLVLACQYSVVPSVPCPAAPLTTLYIGQPQKLACRAFSLVVASRLDRRRRCCRTSVSASAAVVTSGKPIVASLASFPRAAATEIGPAYLCE